MSKDEKVDGAKVAAQILNNMHASRRERLLNALNLADPKLTQKISANLVVFEDIADLTSQGVQLLIREVQHKDLVVSLKTASDRVKSVLFANMSERKRKALEEDYAALPPMKISEIEEAQGKIARRLDELRTGGLIRSQTKEDLWV